MTFVDMSHLNYLSRSMAKPSTVLTKPKNALPKNVKQAIIEESSESKESDDEL